MKKIAAAIITFNEEKNIERCIKGLIDCVDEIVVLDSFSSDRTKEICERYQVRFVQKEWEGYAKTKNKLNDLIDAEYIFSIDADEVPDIVLREDIRKIKEDTFNGIYILNRKTNYCGKWIKYCGWYPEYKKRIFPNSQACWKGDFVHEYLSFDSKMKFKNLNGHLEHYSYYNRQEHRSRANKYAVLSAQKYYNTKRKVFFLQSELSAVVKFLNIFIFKMGFLDGIAGFHIAWISGLSNRLKYKELRKMYAENKVL